MQSGEQSLLGCAREDCGSWWGTRNLRLVKLGGSKEDALSSMPPQRSLLCPAGRKDTWGNKAGAGSHRAGPLTSEPLCRVLRREV